MIGNLAVRIALATLLGAGAISGCATGIGPEKPWVAWDQIEGPLRPEVSAEPPSLSTELTPDPIERLRVVTFNVHHGKDTAAIISAIQQTPSLAQADVFFLQEIQSYPDEGESRTSRIAHGLRMAYAYAPAKLYRNGDRTGTHGNAILSRVKLDSVEVMELPHGRLVVNEERRIALAATIQTSRGPVRLVDVHLDTRLNPSERILQLRPAVLNAPSPVIVAGDFNSNPMTWAFNLVPVIPLGSSDQASILDDYMRTIGYETPTENFGATTEFLALKPRLDSVFVRGLSPGEGAVERSVTVSDHWPLWLQLDARQLRAS